jgi:NADH:ubiquinone oxidoreductase subunit B-like Fe-S oxidoreductase
VAVLFAALQPKAIRFVVGVKVGSFSGSYYLSSTKIVNSNAKYVPVSIKNIDLRHLKQL